MVVPQINCPPIRINQVESSRDHLPAVYQELLDENEQVAELEGSLKLIGWTDEEIRTYQVLMACQSNASLLKRFREYEAMFQEGTRFTILPQRTKDSVTYSRDSLWHAYEECIEQNPLLERIERKAIERFWTDEEIRTYQLLTVCRSNGSLTQIVDEFELSIEKIIEARLKMADSFRGETT